MNNGSSIERRRARDKGRRSWESYALAKAVAAEPRPELLQQEHHSYHHRRRLEHTVTLTTA